MHKHTTIAPAVLRRKSVVNRTGLSAGTIHNLILRGEFPAPFQLTGLRSVGWLERDVDGWIRDRAARVPIARAVTGRAGVSA